MIDHNTKVIFVHIPKTGGQSIERVFLENAGLTWRDRSALLLRKNDDATRGPPRLAHLFASEYVSAGHIEQGQFDEYFKFAFVRNPWARLVSEFRYRYAGTGMVSRLLYRSRFRRFVMQGLPRTGWSDAYRHIEPQVRFVLDQDKRPQVDFIGRFERIGDDFRKVMEVVGIRGRQLPHANRSIDATSRPYMDYYDDETRAAVAHLYREDIRHFGYRFEDG